MFNDLIFNSLPIKTTEMVVYRQDSTISVIIKIVATELEATTAKVVFDTTNLFPRNAS